MTKNEIRKRVDILFESIEEYRTSEYFMELLNFCSRFKMLAPYNSMLVRFQMPGAKYVLTASEWRKMYDRDVNVDARPLVVLFPFGPVNFVFDIQDTHPLGTKKQSKTKEMILADLEKPYETKGVIKREYISKLLYNMAFHSIALNDNMNAGSELGAKIELIPKPYKPIYIGISRDLPSVEWTADYLIGTNGKGEEGQTFASIVHELGHLFCHHILPPADWKKAWKVREISNAAREFEAETISWLVCDRVNLINPSEKYLSYFVDGKIPDGVSIDAIFTAFNKIWDMCTRSYFPYQDGILYKYNKDFQEAVKQTKEKLGSR